jgi:putative membrane protein
MKRFVRLAAASLLWAASASAQTPAAPPTTQDFVTKVAISDMFEIQSSQVALEKQPDQDTKPFAQRMTTDHQKTSKELKDLIEQGKVRATLPAALDAEHKKMLDDLKAKNGKEFDTAYDDIQRKAQTLPHLKEHLAMAQKLK